MALKSFISPIYWSLAPQDFKIFWGPCLYGDQLSSFQIITPFPRITASFPTVLPLLGDGTGPYPHTFLLSYITHLGVTQRPSSAMALWASISHQHTAIGILVAIDFLGCMAMVPALQSVTFSPAAMTGILRGTTQKVLCVSMWNNPSICFSILYL